MGKSEVSSEGAGSPLCTRGARCCGVLAFSLQGEVGKDQASVSMKCWWLLEQSQEHLTHPAQDSPCLLPSARAMKSISRRERRRIVLYLEAWLSNNEPRWNVPAMAFLFEVSPMASGAGLSCLSPLHPLVATAVGRGRPVELGQGFIPWGSSPWHTLPE